MAAPTIGEIWKREAPAVIGGLARLLRDVSVAEELAQDALVAALEQWPRSGIPDNPGAWLMTTARNRALNTLRRARMTERAAGELAEAIDAGRPLAELEAALEERLDPG